MSVLRIRLFGNVRIAHDDWRSEAKTTHAVQALLAFLLLQRHRAHPRESLAGTFWGDRSESRARGCLSTALWRLRQVLEPKGIASGTYLVTTSTGEVRFNGKSDHWLDVAVFEEVVTPILATPVRVMDDAAARELEAALELYTGELLEGFFDDWALRERERLRGLYLNSLAHLMQYHKNRGDYEQSLGYGQRILDYDPLREEIHRELMRLYVENGQRALAVRQYETCCEVLDAELSIPPMEETRALHDQITTETGRHRVQPSDPAERTTFQNAIQQLQHAMQDLDQAQLQLQRAIQLVERCARDTIKRT